MKLWIAFKKADMSETERDLIDSGKTNAFSWGFQSGKETAPVDTCKTALHEQLGHGIWCVFSFRARKSDVIHWLTSPTEIRLTLTYEHEIEP